MQMNDIVSVNFLTEIQHNSDVYYNTAIFFLMLPT
jgi:hypothetical protein